MKKIFALLGLLAASPAFSADDPYLWLEEVQSPAALDWVRARNAQTLDLLEKQPQYKSFYKTALELSNDKERIPYASFRGGYFYNFWQDEKHVRGMWRRATQAEYLAKNPRWETLLDVDALAKKEKENWVYKGADCLPPDYDRCLVSLSRGGKDAVVTREFDVPSRSFVTVGFFIPESKSDGAWLDRDTLLVSDATDPALNTDSGYPRIVRRLKRGGELAKSEIVFTGEKTDVSARGFAIFRPEGSYPLLTRAKSFFEAEIYLLKPDGSRSKLRFPDDASFSGFFRGYALASLRSDWKMPGAAFRRGSLVAVKIEDITGAEEPQAAAVKTVFEPSPRASLQGVADTRDALLLDTLDNIRSRTLLVRESSGAWISSEIPQLGGGVSGISSANSFSDVYTASYNDFLTPHRLYMGDASKPEAPLSLIKELPARFDASGYVLEQGSATSRDGTVIPYFLVRPKNLRFDGQTPVLLNAYGGFEHSMLPSYAPTTGKLWLEQGGVYALANIRGGGEFGPEWHSAALKQNRQKAFDDFLAVAQNLVDRKITSPSKLGIIGGSNGGLLMGAAFTQRPDLFGAVVCQVPLLDMLRYHKLLAGASWMGEYGDPDSPEMRPYIEAYSPYQNIKPGVKYPPVFFVTSSKDDRVHPGHARKAAAKLLSYGDPVYYFENIDGGHGASANNTELARRLALQYAFLRLQLSGTASRP